MARPASLSCMLLQQVTANALFVKNQWAGYIANIAVPRGGLTINGELAFHENQAASGNTVKSDFCPLNLVPAKNTASTGRVNSRRLARRQVINSIYRA